MINILQIWLKTEIKEFKKLKKTFSSLFFYFALLVFILGTGLTDTPTPFGWYQQFMPNLGGASITDITFLDSLNGYTVTGLRSSNDSAFILRTMNGGDSWGFNFSNSKAFVKIKFINTNTGFTNSFTTIFKTTNAGQNWIPINLPGIFGDDMFVLNQDTIWLAMSEPLIGGVYRTTNEGASWDHQINLGSLNPDHIYMYNARIGFFANSNSGNTYKTTNGGQNWFVIVPNMVYSQMCFIDSLTGWADIPNLKKTTDGGYNWVQQTLPHGGNIFASGLSQFTILNKDTIWGAGGQYYIPGNSLRSMIYKTENGGINWVFQVPDTSINLTNYKFCKFINYNTGWVYCSVPSGVHTTTGGDSNWLTGIVKLNNKLPVEYKLSQNYPNPFNPRTVIRYQITKSKEQISNVKISIFDLIGKHIIDLVNQKQSAGLYEVDFSGSGYSSGVYFYSLYVNDILLDTKKMILLK